MMYYKILMDWIEIRCIIDGIEQIIALVDYSNGFSFAVSIAEIIVAPTHFNTGFNNL